MNQRTPVIIITADDVTPSELAQLIEQAKQAGKILLPEPISKLSDLVEKMGATDYGAMPPREYNKGDCQHPSIQYTPDTKAPLPFAPLCGCNETAACEKCTPEPEPLRRQESVPSPLPEIVGDLMTQGYSMKGPSGYRLVRLLLREEAKDQGSYRAGVRFRGVTCWANGVDPMDAVYNAVKLGGRS